MKKGKSKEKKQAAPVPVDDKPNAKMLKLQKKLGKIGKWNIGNTTVVNAEAEQSGEDIPQTTIVPKISLSNQNQQSSKLLKRGSDSGPVKPFIMEKITPIDDANKTTPIVEEGN